MMGIGLRGQTCCRFLRIFIKCKKEEVRKMKQEWKKKLGCLGYDNIWLDRLMMRLGCSLEEASKELENLCRTGKRNGEECVRPRGCRKNGRR